MPKYCLFLLSICTCASLFYTTEGSETYSEKEKAGIKQLRTIMKDVLYRDHMKSDPYLIRWLRASKYNIDDAAENLNKTLIWRKENKIDGIENENLFQVPWTLDGVDNNGGPLIVFRLGQFKYRDHLLSNGRQDILRKTDQINEQIELKTLVSLGVIGNASRPGASALCTHIWDLDGFNIRQHMCPGCVRTILDQLQHMLDHYPGYMRKLVYINVPRIARPLEGLMKPLADKLTTEGIILFGSNKNEWLPVLRKMAQANQLRHYLGGTRKD